MIKDLNYYMGLPYRIEIVKEQEEGGYVLHCPELPGCITCGETVQEGLEMLEDAKKSWFAACLEDNSGQFKLRLPKSLHKQLAQRSSEEGVSMNQYCVHLLSKGL